MYKCWIIDVQDSIVLFFILQMDSFVVRLLLSVNVWKENFYIILYVLYWEVHIFLELVCFCVTLCKPSVIENLISVGGKWTDIAVINHLSRNRLDYKVILTRWRCLFLIRLVYLIFYVFVCLFMSLSYQRPLLSDTSCASVESKNK